MNDELGVYSFLPWVRRGLASALRAGGGPLPTRGAQAEFPVTLHLQRHLGSSSSDQQARVDLRLYGPADVVGIDRSQVRRTEPRHLTQDFEPNYLVSVEFKAPDFPWLLTPTGAASDQSLVPWLVLVVVERQDGVNLTVHPRRPLPTLEIASPARPAVELPPLAESAFWAHVQAAHDPTHDGVLNEARLDRLLQDHPERVLSRLVSPRRLEPRRRYLAVLTPTFKVGADRGLGLQPALSDRLQFAWDRSTDPSSVSLPVYYHWEFQTGLAGDFESLVRQLKARPVPAGVGTRPMDIGHPGYGVDPAPGSRLPMESALRPPSFEAPEWTEESRQNQLRTVLNREASQQVDDAPPLITPPIYGQWPASRETVPPWGHRPRWLGQLNLDLRNRAAAGIGAEVIRKNQETLLHAAWQQVGEVMRANRLLRLAQVGRAVGNKLHRRLFQMDQPAQIQVTAPAHQRVIANPVTFARRIGESRVRAELFSGTFRRIFNRRGVLSRRFQGVFRAGEFLEAFESGRIPYEVASTVPDGTQTLEDVERLAPRPLLPSWLDARLSFWIRLLFLVALLALLVLGVALVLGFGPILSGVVLGIFLAASGSWFVLHRERDRLQVADAVQLTALSPEVIRQGATRPEFKVSQSDAPFRAVRQRRGSDSAEAARFREAAARHMELALEPLTPDVAASRPELDIPATSRLLGARLSPELTITTRVRSRLRIKQAVWNPEDPIEPILAAPEFTEPMYHPLAELSDHHVLAGLDQVPPNTVTLVETNGDFIESYMVGLSHEMARELLWHEYPTEQRATFFRQFWDPRPALDADADRFQRDAAKDMPPIHTWPGNSDLGHHLRSGDGDLVLLVRGELIRRYPGVIVSFVRAEWSNEDLAEVRQSGVQIVNGQYRRPVQNRQEDDFRWPIFSGRLQPDVTFLGFDLTTDEARGAVDEDGDPVVGDDAGWFLVLREPPMETRFGLDEGEGGQLPDRAEDLAWGHVLSQGTHIEVTRPPLQGHAFDSPAVTWGANSAHMSSILIQQPVVVAIHADDMLRVIEA